MSWGRNSSASGQRWWKTFFPLKTVKLFWNVVVSFFLLVTWDLPSTKFEWSSLGSDISLFYSQIPVILRPSDSQIPDHTGYSQRDASTIIIVISQPNPAASWNIISTRTDLAIMRLAIYQLDGLLSRQLACKQGKERSSSKIWVKLKWMIWCEEKCQVLDMFSMNSKKTFPLSKKLWCAWYQIP